MALNVHVIECDIDPNAAPTLVGQHWVNTTLGRTFFSIGTSSVSDWVEVDINIFGSRYQYAASEGSSTTTSTTFQQKLRMTTSSLPAGDFRIGYYFEVSQDNGDKRFNAQVELNDTTLLAQNTSATNIVTDTGDGFAQSGGFKEETLIAGVHTVDIDFRATTDGGTIEIRRARIELWRVN